MKKLWKVTVNRFGWNYPKTFYVNSRENAEKLSENYDCADPVLYAGNFTDDKAAELETILYTVKPEYFDLWFGNNAEATPETVITDPELDNYPCEWGTTREALLEQLTQI